MGVGHPDVSVFMPVKNGASYVEDAVRSVLAQTHGNFELIVVEDGSTDATPDILARLALEDDRICVLKLDQNHGAAFASNCALDIATGEFAARFDADDLVDPNWLATALAYLSKHPKIDILGVSRRVINPDGSVIREEPISEDAMQVDWIARFRWPFVHSGMMFRLNRGPQKPEARYDPDYKLAHDFDFCARYLADSKGVNLPDVLVSYRVHGGALSQNHWAEQHRSAGEIVTAAQERTFQKETFEKLAAFRAAYYFCESPPPREVLAGLVAAISHEMPAGAAYRRWMSCEAFRIYLIAMGRGGRHYWIAVLLGFLLTPRMVAAAIIQKVLGLLSAKHGHLSRAV